MAIYMWKEITPITIPWIYHNADLWLISMSSDWSTWLTIADKNLGATQVYNSWDTLSETNCWKYYQWGNNYGFPFTWAVTTSSTQVNASSYWPWNYYNSSTFITRSSSPYNWDSSDNANLRWWVTWTVEAKQWPCTTWFHIPSNLEWQALYDAWVSLWLWTSSSWTPVQTYLKIPFAGLREYSSAGVNYQSSRGYYLSSTHESANYIYYMYLNSTALIPQISSYSVYGFSIRPFANIPTQPDESRTKLD